MPKTIAHLVSGASCRAYLDACRPQASVAQQGARGVGVPIAWISEIGGGSMRNGSDALSARRFRGLARGAALHARRDVVAFHAALPGDHAAQGRGPHRDDACAVANENSSGGVAPPASAA